MTDVESSQQIQQLERYADGKIEAPDRYIEYSGQLVIRERFSTTQRWKDEGWDGGRLSHPPYILGSTYCRESDALSARNDHLSCNEVEVYYVEDGEKVRYEVLD